MSEIRNLVTKLNDRNIQNSRESGFTLYVVLALLAMIGFQIISTFEAIYNLVFSKVFFQVIVASWIFLEGVNLLLASFIIKVSFFKEARIVSFQNKKSTKLEVAIKIFQYLIPTLSSLCLILIDFEWYILIVFLFFLALLLLFIFNNIRKKFSGTNSSNRILEDSGFGRSKVNRYENMYLALGLTLIMASISYAIFSPRIVSNESISSLVWFTINLFGLFYVLNIALDTYKSSMINNMLKDLEIQIFIKNMQDDEIVRTLQDQFIGINLKDWLSKKLEVAQVRYIDNIQLMESIIDKWLPRHPNEQLLDKMGMARDKFINEILIIQTEVIDLAYRDRHIYSDLDQDLLQKFFKTLHSKISEFEIHLETRYDGLDHTSNRK